MNVKQTKNVCRALHAGDRDGARALLDQYLDDSPLAGELLLASFAAENCEDALPIIRQAATLPSSDFSIHEAVQHYLGMLENHQILLERCLEKRKTHNPLQRALALPLGIFLLAFGICMVVSMLMASEDTFGSSPQAEEIYCFVIPFLLLVFLFGIALPLYSFGIIARPDTNAVNIYINARKARRIPTVYFLGGLDRDDVGQKPINFETIRLENYVNNPDGTNPLRKLPDWLEDSIIKEARMYYPNDLARIAGINPEVEAALNTAGVFTYEQIAVLNSSQLHDLLKEQLTESVENVDFITTWPQQAQLADEGNFEGLATLQTQLSQIEHGQVTDTASLQLMGTVVVERTMKRSKPTDSFLSNVGVATHGHNLVLVGRNTAGTWVKLEEDSEMWVKAADLEIDGNVMDLPLVLE
ncbi:MAG: hypothetical protein GYB65_14230 [Chloroflexi bacterium]|nr:hypothetical protein [Chloroflexota bacterium]